MRSICSTVRRKTGLEVAATSKASGVDRVKRVRLNVECVWVGGNHKQAQRLSAM